MIRMEDALEGERLSARMLLQVHDELVFEAPDDEIDATLPVIARVMTEAPFPAVNLKVPLARRSPRGAELGRGALRRRIRLTAPRRSPRRQACWARGRPSPSGRRSPA